MVDEDARADPRRRMDVHLEQLGSAALQVEGQGLAPLGPQPVSEPVGLQRLEPLEEQEGLQVALAGRVALEHRAHVRLGAIDDAGVGLMGLLADLPQADLGDDIVAELARDLE